MQLLELECGRENRSQGGEGRILLRRVEIWSPHVAGSSQGIPSVGRKRAKKKALFTICQICSVSLKYLGNSAG